MSKKKKYFLLIPAILLLFITGYPFLWTLCGSFNTVQQLGRISVIPVGVTLKNYIDLFQKYKFPLYIYNTLVYAVVSTVISVLINSLAAYALARLRFPGKSLVFLVILSTMMIPFSVVMIPLFLIIKSMGLTNTLLALILPWMTTGFGIFLLRQFYLGIPKELEEAAKIDGLSYFGVYVNIIIPLSKPILLALALTAFLNAWNNYLWPLIINSKEEVWVITTGIANFSNDRTSDWNMILTGAMVSVIPTTILFAFFQKQLIEGVKLSGIK